MGWLPAMLCLESCGTQLRTSSCFSNLVAVVILPDKSPLAIGEKGTKPMPCFMQYGMMRSSESRSTIE